MSIVSSAWNITAGGLLPAARQLASQNCDIRPPGTQIELIVVHNISLPPGEFGGPGVMELFTNRIDHKAHPYYAQLRWLQVSAHFFIRRDGEVIQFVPCLMRAWHAGVSSWEGREKCNDFSIGIELEGSDDVSFESAQYKALNKVIEALKAAYPIRGVTGHSDIAPGRKTDPGPHFDWAQVPAI